MAEMLAAAGTQKLSGSGYFFGRGEAANRNLTHHLRPDFVFSFARLLRPKVISDSMQTVWVDPSRTLLMQAVGNPLE